VPKDYKQHKFRTKHRLKLSQNFIIDWAEPAQQVEFNKLEVKIRFEAKRVESEIDEGNNK
jgi:hypothetical protein